jgi:hypothetical protein
MMDVLVELIVGALIMLAIGAMVGAMVERPVAGAFLTLFLGPLGWIVLLIWAKQSDKVKQAGMRSIRRDPDQIFHARKSAPQ